MLKYVNEKLFQKIMKILYGNDSNYVTYFCSEYLFR